MRLTPIHVQCYAGAKADETPRRFTWLGQIIEVGEVLDRADPIGSDCNRSCRQEDQKTIDRR